MTDMRMPDPAEVDPNLPVHHDGNAIRRLGTLPPPEGFRLFRGGEIEIIPESQWVEFDYTTQPNPIKIKDQGQFGACVGHASASAMEWARWLAGETHVELSPWFLYAILCNGYDRGASISEALDLATKTGTSPFADVPYGTINPNRLSAQARQDATNYRIEIGTPTLTFEEMMSEAQRGRVGNFSIGVGARFNNLDADGVPPSNGNLNHSVLFGIGAKKARNGGWLIKCQNSWTDQWGLDGRFYIRKSSIYSGNDSWSITAPIDTPGDPTNPPVVIA